MKYLTLVILIIGAVFADTFIHGCMEGSNNKLNEERNDINRDTDTRMFDSQNGAGGGYYTNPIDADDAQAYRKFYYVGSILTMQWVNQHGAGDNGFIINNFVWQYACDNMGGKETPWKNEGLRDGTSTTQIDEDGANKDDITYGRHEPWGYLEACKARERNKGLWTADQNLDGDTAQYSRQNPGGTIHGFECPEEKDYWPYWHPTPFVDAAYFTSAAESDGPMGCEEALKKSFNNRAYNLCSDNQYNNEKDCKDNGGEWKSYGPISDKYDFVGTPECYEAEWSKENHLGFGRNGRMQTWNVTIWDNPGAVCAMRLRYNMTQGEVKYNLDYRNNDDQSPVQQRDNNGGANDRVEAWAGAAYPDVALQLAVNTNQYFRTFQDRTHTFSIKARPKNIHEAALIYNLGNKGNRGNLQTLYPMAENDFCPEFLEVKKGDIVHMQFHGANFGRGFNRNNAAGAGRTGGNRANRVNMIQIKKPSDNYPMRLEDQTLFDNKETAVLAAMIGQDPDDCDANETGEQNDNNCSKLNASDSGYLNLGLIRMNTTGTFHYMSSRNNHNTNRAMKGTLVVQPPLSWLAILLIVASSIMAVGGAGLGVLAHASKSNPGGRAAAVWDRLASIGGSRFGGGY